MSEMTIILKEVADAGLGAWDAKPFLEKVTEIVPSIIYVFNQQTQSNEYSNRSLGESLGYTAADVQRMGAAMIPNLAHPSDLPRIAAHFQQLASLADGEVATIEYRMRHKNGGWIWLISYETVFDRDEDGAVLRHIGVAADITAQKHAEELALAEKRAADMATEELRSFAYAVSHDLKGPAHRLQLVLDEIVTSHGAGLEGDIEMLLSLARETSGQMSRVVDDVMDYTRVIATRPMDEPIALDVLMTDVVKGLSIHFENAVDSVTVQPMPHVLGDIEQIGLLFRCILKNALTYHADGAEPHVSVSSFGDPRSGMVEVAIQDNGIGIEEEAHEKIFGMFQRLHVEEEYPGSGLGLAIARRIATAHGGNITIDSAPGEGATFKVTLPLA
ncbi:MAG: ATP-binding protein [Pseudomonadota bacterium]